jgi:hypothetical protein
MGHNPNRHSTRASAQKSLKAGMNAGASGEAQARLMRFAAGDLAAGGAGCLSRAARGRRECGFDSRGQHERQKDRRE